MARSRPQASAASRARARAAVAGAALLLVMAVAGLAGCRRLYPMPGPAYHVMLFLAGPGHRLSALNARTMTAARGLATPGDPVALAYNPARAELYALDSGSGGRDPGTLAIFNLAQPAHPAVLRLDLQPQTMALAPDGAVIYIAGRRGGRGALLALDLPSRAVLHRQSLPGHLVALALAPAGVLLVTSTRPAALEIVKLPDLRLAATVPLPAPPTAVVALPYGHKAFVLCPAANELAVVDLAPPAAVLTYLSIGPNPKAMVLKPDGGELFVSNYGEDGGGATVSAVDTTANQVEGSIAVGTGPWGLAISPGGNRLYVANHQANTVDVVNLQTRHLAAAIPVGLGPEQLRLGGLGAYLFVADQTSNDIGVIRTDIPALVTLLPAPPGLRAMQVASFRSPAKPARMR